MAERTRTRRLSPRQLTYETELLKPLPHSVEIEAAILGAILRFNEDRVCQKVMHEIRPEYFYLTENQLIMTSILSIIRKNHPLDLLSVTEECRQDGSLDRIGGAYYITTLNDQVIHPCNLDFHFRILYQYYIRRKLIESSMQIASLATDDTKDMFDLLDDFITEMESCRISRRFNNSRAAAVVADEFIMELGSDSTNDASAAQSRHFTGHRRFDETVTISRNKIILLAGGAKHGKSKLVAHFMFELLERYKDVSVFWVTLEDSETDILRSYLSSKVLIKSKWIREKQVPGDFQPLIQKWIKVFSSFDIEFRDQVISSLEIVNQFNRFCQDRQGKFPILVVDNVMSLKDREKYQHDLNGMYDYVMHNMLICRQKTNGLIWVLHHYNDAQQDEKGLTKGYRPRLQDIKGTEAFRRVPNQVLMINNPSKYKDLISQYHGDQRELLKYLFIIDVGANREDDVSDETALLHYFCSLDFNLFKEIKIPERDPVQRH